MDQLSADFASRAEPPADHEAGRRYCLLDLELPEEARRSIAEQLDRRIEVITERRRGERRGGERRQLAGDTPNERRRVRNTDGRRVGERRARLVACDESEIPPALRRWNGQLSLVRREPPAPERSSDLDDLRLVIRLQSGDESAFDAIYHRYLARFHAYAQAALGDTHEAEDAVQEVFLKMLRFVPRYELRGTPFRVWLFRVLGNEVRNRVAKANGVVVEEPGAIAHRLDDAAALEDEVAFEHLAQADFIQGIAGLPEAQRKVLALRFLLGMDLAEIAQTLDSSPNAVANVQYRALGSLRAELGGSGEREAPRRRTDLAMRRLCVASRATWRWRAAAGVG